MVILFWKFTLFKGKIDSLQVKQEKKVLIVPQLPTSIRVIDTLNI